MKKIIPLILAVVVIAGGYMYYQSSQKPVDTFVATDVTNETITGAVQAEPVVSTVVRLDNAYVVASDATVGWKATKAGGFHTGTIALTNGFLNVSGDNLLDGQFTIAMDTVKVLDITDASFEDKIKNDFFEASTYPTSTFTITKIESQATGSMVYGDLTIKNTTQAISFPAQITMNNGTMMVKANFAIDRNLRGLTMRQGMVNDYLEFTLDLTLAQ